MPERTTDPRRELAIDRALYRYVAALDRGDLDAVAAVLREAEDDAELETELLAVNDAYDDEDDAAAHEQDAAVVRQLLRRHLTAARDAPAEPRPLTIGDVAARVQSDAARGGARTDEETLAVSRRLSADATPLPDDLSKPAIRRLFAQLGLEVSARFRALFRDTAIDLGMGRHQGAMRLAATRRQQAARRAERERQDGAARDE